MKTKVVWVTSDEVKLFTMGHESPVILHPHGVQHPKEAPGHDHTKAHDDVERFMHEVARTLDQEPARLLLVGPAQAKTRLKKHLDREHPKTAKNVVGIEAMDKATDGEILNFARKFFTKLDAFDAI